MNCRGVSQTKTHTGPVCWTLPNTDERNNRRSTWWRYILYSWIGRLSMVKILLELMFRFNTIPIKIPANFFLWIDKIILKSIWKCKRTRIVNTLLKRRLGWEESVYVSLRHYATTVIKTCVVLAEGQLQRWLGQNIEARNKPHKLAQLIFGKGAKVIQWEKDHFFNKSLFLLDQCQLIVLEKS